MGSGVWGVVWGVSCVGEWGVGCKVCWCVGHWVGWGVRHSLSSMMCGVWCVELWLLLNINNLFNQLIHY